MHLCTMGSKMPHKILTPSFLDTLYFFYLIFRESTEDLKNQLYHERTEGRRKLIAEKRKGSEGKDKSLSQRWKNILPNVSASNSFKSKADTSQPSTIYASIKKVNDRDDNSSMELKKAHQELQWTNKERQILRKIQVLERPSVSSFNPTSLR